MLKRENDFVNNFFGLCVKVCHYKSIKMHLKIMQRFRINCEKLLHFNSDFINIFINSVFCCKQNIIKLIYADLTHEIQRENE